MTSDVRTRVIHELSTWDLYGRGRRQHRLGGGAILEQTEGFIRRRRVLFPVCPFSFFVFAFSSGIIITQTPRAGGREFVGLVGDPIALDLQQELDGAAQFARAMLFDPLVCQAYR